MNYLILLSTLISAIKSVEVLLPDSQGADKFKAVVTIVEGVVGSVAPMLPAIEGIVATVVAGLNATGVFKKKTA